MKVATVAILVCLLSVAMPAKCNFVHRLLDRLHKIFHNIFSKNENDNYNSGNNNFPPIVDDNEGNNSNFNDTEEVRSKVVVKSKLLDSVHNALEKSKGHAKSKNGHVQSEHNVKSKGPYQNKTSDVKSKGHSKSKAAHIKSKASHAKSKSHYKSKAHIENKAHKNSQAQSKQKSNGQNKSIYQAKTKS